MGFVDHIKTRWAAINLKPSAARSKTVVGLRRAKKIGILYEATDREMVDMVRDLVSELREAQKEVSSLGFVNTKFEDELPKSKLGMDFFGAKGLSFSLKSSAQSVSNFQSEKFDVLLDLNVDANMVLLHIVSVSKSGFIIGLSDKGKSYRDLYFELPSLDKNASRDAKIKQLKLLIETIIKYATAL